MLKKISEVRDGDGFSYYKEKFYTAQGAEAMNDEKMKKLYVDYRMLNKVIELFTSFCPDLNLKTPLGKNSSKKIELLNSAMTSIRMSDIFTQIYDSLESKGDVFYYIYFDKKDVDGKKKGYIIPKLRQLNPENMEYVVLDEGNNPQSYIYRHEVFDEEINYINGEVTKKNEREEIIIFEKGVCHRVVRGKDEKGGFILDDKGKIVMDKSSVLSEEVLSDIIPIIHISANKRQDEKFSIIPAEKYVDLCLIIDQIHSDMRATNRNLGFPKTMLLDCVVKDGDGRIGGFVNLESIGIGSEDVSDVKQGKVVDRQITNGLDSMFKELSHAIDTLYDIVGITNPSIMSRVSSSDSSKMYNQVNMRMEQKIEGYIDNIIEGFKPFFKILLVANKLYNEKDDYGYSFEKPKSIIKNSAYDELLIKQLELNTGIKSLYDVLKEKGYNDDSIEEHFKHLNNEVKIGSNSVFVQETKPSKIDGKVYVEGGVEIESNRIIEEEK